MLGGVVVADDVRTWFDLDPLPDGAGAHVYVPQNIQLLELALSPPAPVPQSAAQPQPRTATRPIVAGRTW